MRILVAIGVAAHVALLAMIIGLMVWGGCGGSPTPPEPNVRYVLHWTPPTQYGNGAPFDPYTEVANYEIYLSDSTFAEDMIPAASVAGVQPDGKLATEFDLSVLGPGDKMVAMRTLAKTGARSTFSNQLWWGAE